jgi:hypothetical protein
MKSLSYIWISAFLIQIIGIIPGLMAVTPDSGTALNKNNVTIQENQLSGDRLNTSVSDNSSRSVPTKFKSGSDFLPPCCRLENADVQTPQETNTATLSPKSNTTSIQKSPQILPDLSLRSVSDTGSSSDFIKPPKCH